MLLQTFGMMLRFIKITNSDLSSVQSRGYSGPITPKLNLHDTFQCIPRFSVC
jgi:hypothetical protein